MQCQLQLSLFVLGAKYELSCYLLMYRAEFEAVVVGKGNDGDSDENSDASADDADFSATVDSGRNDSADTKTADVLVTDNMEEDGKCIERTDDDSDGDR